MSPQGTHAALPARGRSVCACCSNRSCEVQTRCATIVITRRHRDLDATLQDLEAGMLEMEASFRVYMYDLESVKTDKGRCALEHCCCASAKDEPAQF